MVDFIYKPKPSISSHPPSPFQYAQILCNFISNMSTPTQYFSGTGNPPTEKSKFAQTCNRLSLFLKEKGNLKNLHLEINGKSDDIGKAEKSPGTTMTFDLLSNMENQGQETAQTENTVNLLPRYVSFDSFVKPEDSTKKVASGKQAEASESRNAQMTIFYDGEVVVFDDMSTDRARDVMLAAAGKVETGVELASTSNHPTDASRSKEPIDAQLEANGLDLPIARRASLHKFLAKRKDRATVRAPYQLHNPGAGPSMNERKFDLNL